MQYEENEKMYLDLPSFIQPGDATTINGFKSESQDNFFIFPNDIYKNESHRASRGTPQLYWLSKTLFWIWQMYYFHQLRHKKRFEFWQKARIWRFSSHYHEIHFWKKVGLGVILNTHSMGLWLIEKFLQRFEFQTNVP